MQFVIILVAFFAAHQAVAQNTTFLSAPTELWTANVAPLGVGNECAFAPTTFNPLLICTSSEGTVTALDASSTTAPGAGWTYFPSATSSSSGVTFSSNGTFFVYSTTDTSGTVPYCHVHAVSTSKGEAYWVLDTLEGTCSGTPILSGNDEYAFVTHNGNSSGTFSVLSVDDGSVVFNQVDPSNLLSPPGIYFSPMQGNYADGIGNNNDIVVFGNKPAEGASSVASDSSIFAFQFPVGYPTSTSTSPRVVVLFANIDFEATTPPLITNGGYSMFWGVSRSNVVAWLGGTFDRDPGGATYGFGRGNPPSLPVLADLAIGADTTTPTLYTGNAGPGFAALSTAGDLALLWSYTTTSPVYTQAKVAPATADEVVFFIEQLGTVYALNAASGTLLWANETKSAVLGSFAINSARDTIYFADAVGILRAWQVAEFPPPAPPTEAPVAPTPAPTKAAPSSSPAAGSSPSSKPAASSATSDPTTAAPTGTSSIKAPTSPAPTTRAPASGALVLLPARVGYFVASLLVAMLVFV